jgi:dipeptidyl-peptidase-3
MSKLKIGMMMLSGALAFASCKGTTSGTSDGKEKAASGYSKDFKVEAEAFADLQLLRYEVPGWDDLTLHQKSLA